MHRQRKSQDPQWIDGHNILGKIHIGNNTHRISLVGERYFREYDTMLLGDNEANVNGSPCTLDTVRRRRLSFGYDFQPETTWLNKLKFKFYNQNIYKLEGGSAIHERFRQGGPSSTIKKTGDYKQDIWAIKTDLNGRLYTGTLQHTWAAGAQYRWEDSQRKKWDYTNNPGSGTEVNVKKHLPDMEANTLAVYIQDSITLPFGLVVTPGVRYEKWHYRPTADADYLSTTSGVGAEIAKKMDNTTICPKLHISYPFTRHFTGYGSIAWGGKNPPLQLINGMISPGHIAILPGTDLKPEKTRNHELGLLYNSPKLDISLVGFYNIYHDMFVYDVVDDPVYGFGFGPTNHDRADIYGAEASLTWRFIPNWFLKGSVSFTKGDRDRGELSQSMRPMIDSKWAGSNPLQGIIGIGYDNNRFGFSLDCFMSKPYEPDSRGWLTSTPGFAVVDMNGWWKINDYLEINAGVYNLLDKKYWQGIDLTDEGGKIDDITYEKYTMPGINFILGLKMHF